MKKIVIILLFFVFIFTNCSSTDGVIKKSDNYNSLYNGEIDGIQEDKLKQAEENFYKGDYSKSLEIYNDILPEFVASDSQEFVVHTLFLIATCLLKKRDYEKAFDIYKKIESRVKLNFEGKEFKYFKSLYMIELGNLFIHSNLAPSNHYKLALLKKGLELAEDNESRYLLMKAYRNLGFYYLTLIEKTKKIDWTKEENPLDEIYERSLTYLKRAFILSNKSRNVYVLADSAYYLGRLYYQKSKYNSALENYAMAYRLYNYLKSGFYFQQSKVLIKIGEVFEKSKDLKTAFRYYKRANEMINLNENLEEIEKKEIQKIISEKVNLIETKLPDLKTYKIPKLHLPQLPKKK